MDERARTNFQTPPSHRIFRTLRWLHDFAFSRETLVFATVLTAAILLWFTPTSRSLTYRNFIASLTQDLVLAKVNPHREALGAVPLRTDPLLSEAARLKAEDMIARDYFAHADPDGNQPWTWFDRVGYRYAAAGENLAIDFSDPTALVNAWLASPSHAANIENVYFSDIGIGIARGDFVGRDTTAVVMFLGRPVTSPLTIVAPPAPLQPAPIPAPQKPSTPKPLPPPPVPTQTPAHETTPVPTPDASPLPSPSSPPTVPSTPVPTISPRPPAAGTQTPLPEPAVSPDIPFIASPAGDAFMPRVITTEIAPTPLRTNALAFILVKAALFLRIILSAFFGATLTASAVLLTHPAHRPAVRMLPPGLILFLLAVLWLPEVF